MHIGGTDQIGRRHAQADTGIDQGEQSGALGDGRPEIEIGDRAGRSAGATLEHQEGRPSRALVVPWP